MGLAREAHAQLRKAVWERELTCSQRENRICQKHSELNAQRRDQRSRAADYIVKQSSPASLLHIQPLPPSPGLRRLRPPAQGVKNCHTAPRKKREKTYLEAGRKAFLIASNVRIFVLPAPLLWPEDSRIQGARQ